MPDMNDKAAGKLVGVIFAVIILLAMGATLFTTVNYPVSQTFSLPSAPAHPPHEVNITLYADASGWDYLHGPSNPTITILNGTLVHFTVIEEDNQPHTLTINPGSSESSYSDTLLSTSQITTTPGHISYVTAYFDTVGVFTYWCTIHPTTMVGLINVVSSLPSNVYKFPTPPSSATVTAHVSLTATNSGFTSSNGTNPNLFFGNDSLVNFTIIQNGTSMHDFIVAPGDNVSSFNSTVINATEIGTTNGRSVSVNLYFNTTEEFTYWDSYYPSKTVGHIFITRSTSTASIAVTDLGLVTGGTRNWTLPVAISTAVVLHFEDTSKLNYSVMVSSDRYSAVSNGTLVSTTNASTSVEIASYNFTKVTLIDNKVTSGSTGNILYYEHLRNITLYANHLGWNYSVGSVNPVFNLTLGTMVNFTLINGDGLDHTLAISYGNLPYAGTTENVTSVNSTVKTSFGYFLFQMYGTYTYFDTYHPSSAVSSINVTNETSASASVAIPFTHMYAYPSENSGTQYTYVLSGTVNEPKRYN